MSKPITHRPQTIADLRRRNEKIGHKFFDRSHNRYNRTMPFVRQAAGLEPTVMLDGERQYELVPGHVFATVDRYEPTKVLNLWHMDKSGDIMYLCAIAGKLTAQENLQISRPLRRIGHVVGILLDDLRRDPREAAKLMVYYWSRNTPNPDA